MIMNVRYCLAVISLPPHIVKLVSNGPHWGKGTMKGNYFCKIVELNNQFHFIVIHILLLPNGNYLENMGLL